MSALEGHTPYEVVYGIKPDLADLCMFNMPCAVVELSKKSKLNDWATLCVVVGYKYRGGGYRLWDLRRSVVVESRLCSASHLLKFLSRNIQDCDI